MLKKSPDGDDTVDGKGHIAVITADERERRRFFRLRYPLTLRPVARARGERFEVAEVSEEGLVLWCPALEPFRLGEPIHADVRFADGCTHGVIGRVLRIRRQEIIIQLTHQGFPTGRIFSEELAVVRNAVHLAETA
jgi:hypothetical protein